MIEDAADLLLERMTWEEAQAALDSKRVLIIPIGAIEQHGPHLPLATDAIVAFELARRAARRQGAVVAPAMCYAARSSPRSGGGGRSFAGSTGVTGQTLISLVRDVTAEFFRSGFRRVAYLNAHYENSSLVYEALTEAIEPRLGTCKAILVNWWEQIPGRGHRADLRRGLPRLGGRARRRGGDLADGGTAPGPGPHRAQGRGRHGPAGDLRHLPAARRRDPAHRRALAVRSGLTRDRPVPGRRAGRADRRHPGPRVPPVSGRTASPHPRPAASPAAAPPGRRPARPLAPAPGAAAGREGLAWPVAPRRGPHARRPGVGHGRRADRVGDQGDDQARARARRDQPGPGLPGLPGARTRSSAPPSPRSRPTSTSTRSPGASLRSARRSRRNTAAGTGWTSTPNARSA